MANTTGIKNYTPEDKLKILTDVFTKIESGLSWREAIKDKSKGKGKKAQIIANRTFFDWIEADAAMMQQYSRACAVRHDLLAEKIVEITSKPMITERRVKGTTAKGFIDTIEYYDNTQRTQQHANALIWYLSKLAPKKFGKESGGSDEFVEQPLFNDID